MKHSEREEITEAMQKYREKYRHGRKSKTEALEALVHVTPWVSHTSGCPISFKKSKQLAKRGLPVCVATIC